MALPLAVSYLSAKQLKPIEPVGCSLTLFLIVMNTGFLLVLVLESPENQARTRRRMRRMAQGQCQAAPEPVAFAKKMLTPKGFLHKLTPVLLFLSDQKRRGSKKQTTTNNKET